MFTLFKEIMTITVKTHAIIVVLKVVNDWPGSEKSKKILLESLLKKIGEIQ